MRSHDPELASVPAGLHPTRSARLVLPDGAGRARRAIGVVGEVDPGVLEEFGIDAERRRVGWLEVDLEALLTDAPRRSPLMSPVSRFPSSDVDLAFVVDDAVPAAAVETTLRRAGGELLESLALFDVYRGVGMPRDAQPGVPPAVVCLGPHPDRRGGRRGARPVHRRGGAGPRRPAAQLTRRARGPTQRPRRTLGSKSSAPRARSGRGATSRPSLHAEGLTPHAWGNAAGFSYGRHVHEYHKVLFCVSGSIVFHTDAGDVVLGPGDRMELPPGSSTVPPWVTAASSAWRRTGAERARDAR